MVSHLQEVESEAEDVVPPHNACQVEQRSQVLLTSETERTLVSSFNDPLH